MFIIGYKSEINGFIKKNYNVEFMWDKVEKTGVYELKYRKSGINES